MIENFIGYYQIDDLSICDDIITYWKLSDNKIPGLSYRSSDGVGIIDTEWKDSIDVLVMLDDVDPLLQRYIAIFS
jgi:hypothetical protein